MKWFPESNVPKNGWTPISRPSYVFSGWASLLLNFIAIGLIVYGYLIGKTMGYFPFNMLLAGGAAPLVLVLLLLFQRNPRPYPPMEQQEKAKPAQDDHPA